MVVLIFTSTTEKPSDPKWHRFYYYKNVVKLLNLSNNNLYWYKVKLRNFKISNVNKSMIDGTYDYFHVSFGDMEILERINQ